VQVSAETERNEFATRLIFGDEATLLSSGKDRRHYERV
jgi:hypothetical protein